MTQLNRGALAVSAVLAMLTLGLRAELNKTEWASWVQAVGSIAAIFGAYWIASWQFKQGLRRDREVRAEVIDARTTLLRHLIEAARSVADEIDQGECQLKRAEVQDRFDHFEELDSAWRRIEVEKLQSAFEVRHHLLVARNLDQLFSVLTGWKIRLKSTSEETKLFDAAVARLELAREHYDAAAENARNGIALD